MTDWESTYKEAKENLLSTYNITSIEMVASEYSTNCVRIVEKWVLEVREAVGLTVSSWRKCDISRRILIWFLRIVRYDDVSTPTTNPKDELNIQRWILYHQVTIATYSYFIGLGLSIMKNVLDVLWLLCMWSINSLEHDLYKWYD